MSDGSMLMFGNRGKVFVCSGLIPICENEDGLAAILGHEIAHNIAHHAGERLSSALALGAFAYLLSLIFDLSPGLINKFFDIGYRRPGSRQQEVCSYKEMGSYFLG